MPTFYDENTTRDNARPILAVATYQKSNSYIINVCGSVEDMIHVLRLMYIATRDEIREAFDNDQILRTSSRYENRLVEIEMLQFLPEHSLIYRD
jgi:hypothetical protein